MQLYPSNTLNDYHISSHHITTNTMEWSKQTYNSQYEKWVPWAEDLYLRWFTNDNKASYTAKRT